MPKFVRKTSLGLIILLLAACNQITANSTERVVSFPKDAVVQLFYGDDGTEANLGTPGPRLSDKQIKKLEGNIYIRKIEADEEFAACFIPHHFFRYFDKKGKELGVISVCFCCYGASLDDFGASPVKTDEHLYMRHGRMEALVKELGVPTDINCD